FAYVAERDDELTLVKGSRVMVLEKCSDGWWRGGSAGRTGCSVTEEELNFDKGEVMEVVEKPEDDPEWWRCRNGRGAAGLVPKNYVVVLSDGPRDPGARGSSPSPYTAGPAGSGRFGGRDWYYGGVTRVQAESALNERGLDGDFLVRDSESTAAGKNKHFKVQSADGAFCIGQRRFSSMEELVEHYKRAPIFTGERGDKLYLVRPLH
ncbi:hypothetical protein NHX12_015232, partial [Muraenolepis orangiensis]